MPALLETTPPVALGWFRAAAVPAAAALLLLAACDSAVPDGGPTARPTSVSGPVRAVLVASQLLVGLQRFPLGVLLNNAPVADAYVHLTASTLPRYLARAPIAADAPFRGAGLEGRGLYVAMLPLDLPGPWLADVTVTLRDGTSYVTEVPFQVLVAAAVPTVGQAAPRSQNPTIADVPDASFIDSGTPPDDMHAVSIADAIAAHRPALVVFATPGFCTSATCGPQVHAVQQLEPAHRDRLTFIHVEVYQDFKPDPSKRRLARTVLEWHLQTEPWVFLIDAQGFIAAEFEGTAATDEMEPAIARMLSAG